MQPRSYVIRRFGLGSLVRWGFVAGALVACLPGLLCSGAFFWVASLIYQTIESWRDVGLTIVGQRFSLDFVQLLQLGALEGALRAIQALGVLGILVLSLLIASGLGVITALSLAVLGVMYNFTGRLEIELAEK